MNPCERESARWTEHPLLSRCKRGSPQTRWRRHTCVCGGCTSRRLHGRGCSRDRVQTKESSGSEKSVCETKQELNVERWLTRRRCPKIGDCTPKWPKTNEFVKSPPQMSGGLHIYLHRMKKIYLGSQSNEVDAEQILHQKPV